MRSNCIWMVALGCWILLPLQAPEHGLTQVPERITLDKASLRTDDGDTIDIKSKDRVESVRILGIDTPEILHLDHGIPYAQPFGDVAAGFLRGALAVARKVELLRSGQKDPFGRTLGYIFFDNQNYSVLVLEAQLAVESVTRYGDNGLPAEAAACLAASKTVGPVPFEDPHVYRQRMRKVTSDLKAKGLYPQVPEGK
ncbi:MAG: thermonuclease family protein [Planctomycetes bacterium]|nr:thermonuclease family protein [Planctomycetota bacterium]